MARAERSHPPFRRHNLLPAAIGVCAAASLITVALADLESVSASYVATSAFAAELGPLVGVSLLAAGIAAFHGRSAVVSPALPCALALCWLAADLVGWESGPPVVRSVAMVAVPFVLPIVVHLAVSFPASQPMRRLDVWFVALAYATTAIVTVALAAVRDPYLDLYCRDNCTDNVFLVSAHPDLARDLGVWWRHGVIAIGVALVAWCVWRMRSVTDPARRQMWYVLLPSAAVGASEAAHAVLLRLDPDEDPHKDIFLAAHFARAVALLALGAGVTWAALRARRVAWHVRRLATALDAGPAHGSLRAALRRSLGDESIDVAYWVPDLERFVDSTGNATQVPTTASRTAAIVRADELVAVVTHDGNHLGPDLERNIGSAARLAVDNERMRAELLAHVAELRASQVRIVEAADKTRRGIERDLHDGVQQRLLGLSYEIRLAQTQARQADHPEAVGQLAEIAEEVRQAIDELRQLARGIFPSILADTGLTAALRALAEAAPLPIHVDGGLTSRCGDLQEMAAYRAAIDVIDAAAGISASRIAVHLAQRDDDMVVDFDHDGGESLVTQLTRARDRVGALGGCIAVDGTYISVVIPCASS